MIQATVGGFGGVAGGGGSGPCHGRRRRRPPRWRPWAPKRVWSTTTRKGRRGSGKSSGPAVHDDLIQRQFHAPRPMRCGSPTSPSTRRSWGSSTAAPSRTWSPTGVGYALAERMTAQLATAALRSAIARRQPEGTVVVHSDRGQFRSRAFRAVLTAAGLTGSMGRVASAGDNAAMESFSSLLQKNVLDTRRWWTRDQLHYEIVFWFEHTTTSSIATAHRSEIRRTVGRG